MGLKSLFLFFLVVGSLTGALVYYCPCFQMLFVDVDPPKLQPEYFGKQKITGDKIPKDNPAIRTYQINVGNQTLEDLKIRLARTRFVEPLDNVAFEYGFHASALKKVVDYWQTKFDWKTQEKMLNKFSHFKTQISGLDIHFIHQKPAVKDKKVRVLPLLLIHGWPGSVAEFTKILPLLTTPKPSRDYVFEVICPSIPGYGFSEAAHKSGFNSASAAQIFATLMDRLGIKKYYIQGGDWGSLIASVMSKVYTDRVLGVHLNMFPERLGLIGYLKYAAGYVYPSMFMTPEEYDSIYPLSKVAHFFLEESGYFHIQATKPDTIGASLIDSPAGLAAYILEKFSTASDPDYRARVDGGLTEKFTMDELLTNVMIYWTTKTAASSVRFYKENMAATFRDYGFEYLPIKVPSGVATFPHEILCFPKSFITHHMRNLVHYNRMPRGGHFAAMEEPELLSNEIWDFVAAAEKAEADKKKAEKK